MRCLTLAAALQGAGWRCAFACNPEAAQTVKALGEAGLPVAPAEGLAAAWPDGCDLLVVDHYGLDAGWEAAQRPWARRVLAIDDLADRPHDCDLLLDGNLGRQAVDYAGRVPAGCTLLVGARYALLRGSSRRRARRPSGVAHDRRFGGSWSGSAARIRMTSRPVRWRVSSGAAWRSRSMWS